MLAPREVDDLADSLVLSEIRCHGFETLIESALVSEQFVESPLERLDLLLAESAPLQSYEVETRQKSPLALHPPERDDVVLDARHAADDRVRTDADELKNGGQAADNGMVANLNMPRQGRIVGHDDMIAHNAIMRDMNAHHEKSPIPYHGFHRPGPSAGVHCDMLADGVVGAYDKLGQLALVFEVLRGRPETRERINRGPRPDRCPSVDHDMGVDANARPQHDVRTDNAVRPDIHLLAQTGGGGNDRGGVYGAIHKRFTPDASGARRGHRKETAGSAQIT